MRAIDILMAGNWGAEPFACPIDYPVPDNRGAYIVPREERALLALIVRAHKELSAYTGRQPYWEHSRIVQSLAYALDERMHARADVVGQVVEYHSDWLYSVLTYADIVREHKEFEKKNPQKETGVCPEGGLSFAYLEREPETCTLWEYMTKK